MATENGQDVPYSAVQYVQNTLGLQVCAIAKLADLMQYLAQGGQASSAQDHQRVLAYRARYGVDQG
jgi:orotate phosphoribosyltransferase